MTVLRTARYRGEVRPLCPARGCSCVMLPMHPLYRARHPDGPTHRCGDWECWGRAWIADGGTVERVVTEPPNPTAWRLREVAAD